MRENEPSSTALGVALARSRLQRPATATGDTAGEEALVSSLLDEMPADYRSRYYGIDNRQVDVFMGYISARTAFFDQAVLDAQEAGVRQIVILGAGYDGRALRFRAPGVQFFEVDHPATQTDKRSRLERLEVPTDGIIFVSADFTEPGLDVALADAGYHSHDRTQYICEGVLRYLPEHWFRELLAVTARQASTDSKLAVSISTLALDPNPDDAAARQAHDQRLAERGEAVLTVPEREVALAWLAEAGWTLESVDEADRTATESRPGRLLVRARIA